MSDPSSWQAPDDRRRFTNDVAAGGDPGASGSGGGRFPREGAGLDLSGSGGVSPVGFAGASVHVHAQQRGASPQQQQQPGASPPQLRYTVNTSPRMESSPRQYVRVQHGVKTAAHEEDVKIEHIEVDEWKRQKQVCVGSEGGRGVRDAGGAGAVHFRISAGKGGGGGTQQAAPAAAGMARRQQQVGGLCLLG